MNGVPARALMVLGTASSVGKSMFVTALCRIFADMGIDVAPFKAQNISLNSAATPDGFEIGRSQALQAEATRKVPSVDMNPVLIKPEGNGRAQVIVNGTIWAEIDTWQQQRSRSGELFAEALSAYERLAQRCKLIVLEGAGSPAEINLRDGDIVNLRMARATGARCILIGDIDRGGVFASLLGTLELLEPEERRIIRGFVINKFRGELSLLAPGIAQIEARLGIPCFGVIPWIDDLNLDEEDSCGSVRSRAAWTMNESSHRPLRIAVIELPSLANATDFAALAAEPEVQLRWVRAPVELQGADVAIVPGSKHTLNDLKWMRAAGLDVAVSAHADSGKATLGICGGLQILGRHISDPYGVEGGGEGAGLSLIEVSTTLSRSKTTIPIRATLAAESLFGQNLGPLPFTGYEIHAGDTTTPASPFARLIRYDGSSLDDGAVAGAGNIVGTYVHGLFDDDSFRHRMLDALRLQCGLSPAKATSRFTAERDQRLERLASEVRNSVDVNAILAL